MPSHETGGTFAHGGSIAKFMSMMGGLHSSSQDRRVMVIRAMNIPFHLDHTALRRLHWRLLIHLQGEKRREIFGILLRGDNVVLVLMGLQRG